VLADTDAAIPALSNKANRDANGLKGKSNE
jgi:hypothetical protein